MTPPVICECNKMYLLENIIRTTFKKYNVSQAEYYIHQEAWDEIFFLFFHRLPENTKDPDWNLLFESDKSKGQDALAIIRQLSEHKE